MFCPICPEIGIISHKLYYHSNYGNYGDLKVVMLFVPFQSRYLSSDAVF